MKKFFDSKIEKAKMKIKAVANVANNDSDTPVLTKLKLDKKLVKKVMKENNYNFYETTLNDIRKKEINEKGEHFSPLASFINSTNDVKFVFIDFSNEDKIKKQHVESITNAIIYSEIDSQPILNNTVFVVDDNLINILEEYSKKKDCPKIELVLETLITL